MRIIACFDDGYFPPIYKSRKGYTLLVGVSTLDASTILSITYTYVLIDGRSVTDKIIDMARLMDSIELILLDGVTYAGFDTADPEEIYLETNIPTITIQQYPLNLENIRKALMKHFNDYVERYSVIEKIVKKLHYLDTPWKTIQYYPVGIDLEQARNILYKTMIYSPVPEPLRIAHMLASGIAREKIIGG